MISKILKVYFVYGGLLLIANLITGLIFYFLFGGSIIKTISSIIFGITFAWIAGYKGVKAIIKIQGYEKYGTAYSHGFMIVLVQSILGSIFAYIFLKQIFILEGLIYLLGGAHGGKLALELVQKNTNIVVSKPIKILFGIILGLFVLFCLFLAGNSVFYKFFDIKTVQQGQNIQYVDKKFGYSFVYPKSWKKTANPFTPGYVTITSDKDPQTSLGFWYKDSPKINTVDELKKFVEDDAKYSEENQNGKTESIEETILNGKDVVLWKTSYQESSKYTYWQQYYIADYEAQNQNIYVWIMWIATENKKEPNEKEVVTNILNSFKFIP